MAYGKAVQKDVLIKKKMHHAYPNLFFCIGKRYKDSNLLFIKEVTERFLS